MTVLTVDTSVAVSATNFHAIQAAVNAASAGDTIVVAAGTYNENVTINKSLILLSESGAGATSIVGQGSSALGAIVISPGVNNVTIGGINQGFTVQGIDNASPGIESAAIYIQGAHDGLTIQGNNVVANGDSGLTSEFGQAITNTLIDSNVFSGQTFVGPNPAGDGFGSQFSTPNVPRQLVVLGGNNTVLDGATPGVTFTNNQITGTAGGINASSQPQGNTLVTIDVANSVITDNIFSGFTNRFATQLRVREENTTVADNTFTNSAGGNLGLFLQMGGSETSGPVVNNSFVGSSGDNNIVGTIGSDVLNGQGGNDTLYGQGGVDTIDGGLGIDTAVYSDDVSVAFNTTSGKWVVTSAADGTETLANIEIIDDLSGGRFLLVGGGGFASTAAATAAAAPGDTILVAPPAPTVGDDVLSSTPAGETLDGGKGNDTADFSLATSSLVINIGPVKGTAYSAQTGFDTLISIENIVGGSGDDDITGSALANTIDGAAGNDTIRGGSGNDMLSGGADKDNIFGGAGNDIIDGGDGDDALSGEAGNDTITGGKGKDSNSGGAGNDTMDGGDDDDILLGDAGNDTLLGGKGNDSLLGGDSQDVLKGGDGADILDGGSGNDMLFADNADTIIIGGAGIDTLTVEGATGVTLEDLAAAGIEKVYGSDGGADLFKGLNAKTPLFIDGRAGADELWGGNVGDKLLGGAGMDLLMGEAGNDTLEGGADADELMGGLGADLLKGDAGGDILHGGAGSDRLYGGGADGAADMFVYSALGWGRDTIYDFENGIDKINFSGNASINSIGDLKIVVSGNSTIVSFGTDAITLLNTKGQIEASDFIF